MTTILNIPEIEKRISQKHHLFLKTYGATIDQSTANDRLLAEKIVAKISRILVCFKDDNIIDTISHEKEGIWKIIHLSKDGYDDSVIIYTNGNDIILRRNNPILIEDFWVHVLQRRYTGVDLESFDWCAFAEGLIDYTHLIIYNKAKAAKQKIDNAFK